MEDTKYFAYYVPENLPTLMNNYKDYIKQEYGVINSFPIIDQIDSNILINDCNTVTSDNNSSNNNYNNINHNNNLNCLVLVKFTLVNDIFVKNSDVLPNRNNVNPNPVHSVHTRNDIPLYENTNPETTNIGNTATTEATTTVTATDPGTTPPPQLTNPLLSRYRQISKNSDYFNTKYLYKDYSALKLKKILFSGTQQHSYEIDESYQYVFTETITIPLDEIMNLYSAINFDSNGNNVFTKQLDNYIKKRELNDSRIENILRLTNSILAPVQYEKEYENYKHLKQYIPLINTAEGAQSAINIIKKLWEGELNKQPVNAYEFLHNHRLLVYNNSYNIVDNNSRYNIKCPISSKLYITPKQFSNITYKDALPFRHFFNTKDTTIYNIDKQHNILVSKITYIENKIINLKKNKCKQNSAARAQTDVAIKSYTEDIQNITLLLDKIDPYYKDHILFNTPVGFRLTFQDSLNSYISLVYLRYVCNNKARLNNNLVFSYEVTENKTYDMVCLYVSKQLLNDLISSNIAGDLFTFSRFYKIKMEDRFQDESYKIINHSINTTHKLPVTNQQNPIKNPIQKLQNFIDSKLALNLFEYQKNNVLWMLKTEDDIDARKLTVNSFVGDFELNFDHIEDIRIYLHNLKIRCPEAFLKNYTVIHNNQKHVIDIRNTATIAQSASIMSILNAENYRNMNNYDHDLDVIEKILPHEEYIQAHSKPIEMCGGALCDEVGLGKTLSIISHLVIKMKDDMIKYGKYKHGMNKIIDKLKILNDKNIKCNENLTSFFDKNATISNQKTYDDQLENSIPSEDDVYDDPLDNGFEYNNLVIVPSRLTSQWESEIEKYVKDKFNLRAKVLVGITSIKILEKELHDFYAKKEELRKKEEAKKEELKKRKDDSKDTDTKNDNDPTTKKTNKKIKINIKGKSAPSNIEPIINSTSIITENINIIEDADIIDESEIKEPSVNDKPINTEIKLTKSQLKAQKTIEKLMKAAKKANDKKQSKGTQSVNEDVKETVEAIVKKVVEVVEVVEPVPEKSNTFESLLQGCMEVEIPIVAPIVTPIETLLETPLETPLESDSNNDTDEYDYINKYIDETLEGSEDDTYAKEYQSNQLYDIYIVSINLLSNENYLNYICHNSGNHLKHHMNGECLEGNESYKLKKIVNYETHPEQICRIIDKFNIFRIKWNRVILDEAHEKLIPVVKMFTTSVKKYVSGGVKIHLEDQFLFENLCAINSNYKWAMTGTPTEHGIDNVMGILEFLTKKNYDDSFYQKMEKIRFLSDIVGISKTNLDNILSRIMKKTYKKDVKALLNIPLFTEEIIYVEQTNIERNIYNTIRCSRHFTEAVRMRRLFLMCTNILINEGYDLNGENDIPTTTEALTLEQLNANMISKFNQQLKQLEGNKNRALQQIEQAGFRMEEWVNLSNYIMGLNLDERISPEILQELNDKFSNIESSTARLHCEMFYNIINVFELWRDYPNIYSIVSSNINMIKEHLYRIWRNTWNGEDILHKFVGYGSRLGEYKIREDIVKKKKAIETFDNDMKRVSNQIALFSNNEFLKEKTSDPCIICFEDLNQVVITQCRHIFCLDCTKKMSNDLKSNFTCPECRSPLSCNSVNITTVANINAKKEEQDLENPARKLEEKDNSVIDITLSPLEQKLGADWKNICVNRHGSKMYELIKYIYTIFENKENRVIIFSQYDKMLQLISITLSEFKIKFVHCSGNNYVLNKNINKFKKDDSYRVILLSSENANSGTNLTEACVIIFVDVLYDNIERVKAMESQAVARALRIGQSRPVKIVRFVTKGTVEEEHFNKNRYDMSILQN